MSSQSRGLSASYLFPLCESLAAGQVDVSALLRAAHIERERLTLPGAMLSLDELAAFLAAARARTGRSDLAFEVGRGIKLNSHDALGYAMLSCATPDQVLRIVSRHYHLMTTAFTLRYRRQGHLGEAVYTPATALSPDLLHFFLEVIAVAHQTQQALLLGERVSGCDIHLSMPAPAHHARYFQLAPARFHFNARAVPGVRVVMDAALLDAPLPMASSRVVQQIEQRLEAPQLQTPGSGQWAAFVTMLLRESRGAQITLEEIAQRLKVSPRTIERALGSEGLKFRALSQKVMVEQACELLRAPGATVSQVAAELGFLEASSFSRFFRREVGVSASEFMAGTEAVEDGALHARNRPA